MDGKVCVSVLSGGCEGYRTRLLPVGASGLIVLVVLGFCAVAHYEGIKRHSMVGLVCSRWSSERPAMMRGDVHVDPRLEGDDSHWQRLVLQYDPTVLHSS